MNNAPSRHCVAASGRSSRCNACGRVVAAKSGWGLTAWSNTMPMKAAHTKRLQYAVSVTLPR